MANVFEDSLLRQDPGAFVRGLGLKITEVTAERVVGVLDAGPQHHQPYGLVHGGVYAGIVETLASFGAAASVAPTGDAVVGVSNSTDFLRPHRSGPLRAVATPLHRGRTQHLWEVAITREADGKTVARGQVRLQVLPAEAVVAADEAGA